MKSKINPKLAEGRKEMLKMRAKINNKEKRKTRKSVKTNVGSLRRSTKLTKFL